jgi:hypothetical protein
MSKKKRWHANSVESRLHFTTPHVAAYESWLRNQGYTASTIEERVRLLAVKRRRIGTPDRRAIGTPSLYVSND